MKTNNRRSVLKTALSLGCLLAISGKSIAADMPSDNDYVKSKVGMPISGNTSKGSKASGSTARGSQQSNQNKQTHQAPRGGKSAFENEIARRAKAAGIDKSKLSCADGRNILTELDSSISFGKGSFNKRSNLSNDEILGNLITAIEFLDQKINDNSSEGRAQLYRMIGEKQSTNAETLSAEENSVLDARKRQLSIQLREFIAAAKLGQIKLANLDKLASLVSKTEGRGRYDLISDLARSYAEIKGDQKSERAGYGGRSMSEILLEEGIKGADLKSKTQASILEAKVDGDNKIDEIPSGMLKLLSKVLDGASLTMSCVDDFASDLNSADQERRSYSHLEHHMVGPVATARMDELKELLQKIENLNENNQGLYGEQIRLTREKANMLISWIDSMTTTRGMKKQDSAEIARLKQKIRQLVGLPGDQ